MKIKRIVLKNFKQFDQFTLTCKDHNILVGPNNAGKSTTLDALRLVADVLRYSRSNRPSRASVLGEGVCASFRVPVRQLSLPIESLSRNYSEDQAVVVIELQDGPRMTINLSTEDGCFAYLSGVDRMPETSSAFRNTFALDLVIAPTLGPFEANERYLTDDTVRQSENTRLAHRHFRNILIRKNEKEFNAFADLLARSWPGMSITKPIRVGTPGELFMNYSERRIPREIHWAGFGFQVWLQMLLQISRGSPHSVLVLDEPDIYLHPDLQRRLLRIVSEKFSQFFIATHSVEIINEAQAGAVASINSSYRSAKRITGEEEFRDLYRYVGSSENAQFSRLARSKRIVFFEGKDIRLLRRFAEKVSSFPTLVDPDTLIVQSGGYGQWRLIASAGWTLNSIFGIEAKITALFDADYRCEGENHEFQTDISGNGILCRVLKKKEIENYCLVPDVLIRAVKGRLASRSVALTESGILAMIDYCLDQMKADVSAQIVSRRVTYLTKNSKGMDQATATKQAMTEFDTNWANLDGRLSVVSGKSMIALLSGVLQKEHGVSLTVLQIIAEMRRDEVPSDLMTIMREFEDHLAS